MGDLVIGTFGATGVSEAKRFDEGVLSIGGTFVGTVELQRRIGQNWQTVESYTAAAEKEISNGSPVQTRLECTAYTSGTVEYGFG